MFGAQITIGQAVTVCLFSLAVVFLVLLAISYLIDLIAWIVRKIEKKDTPKAPAAVSAPAQSTAPAPRDDSVDAVLVAAAVAAYLGKNTDEFVVRSIRRAAAPESFWSQLGRADSLQ